MNMREEELRRLLTSHGWILVTRERQGKKRNATYLLAQRSKAPYNQVYLTSQRQLPIIREEEILEKISVGSR